MRRWVSNLVAAAILIASAPAMAEPSPVDPVQPAPPAAQAPNTQRPARAASTQGPTIAQVEQALGEIGVWSLEYSAIITSAAEVMNEVEGYTAILDRVASRQLRTRAALEEMEAWRTNAVARAQAVRANAAAFRPPPSISGISEEMATLEGALVLARNDLPVLIDEMITSLEAWAAYGAEAIRNPNQVADTRLRAVYASGIQLIRIDTRRLSSSMRAAPANHPNRFMIEAMIAYYAGLSLFPLHELRIVDGEQSDPATVAATLRQYAGEMRASLVQAETHAARTAREYAAMPAPPEAQQLRQTVIQMMESYPESVGLYRQLAEGLDTAASGIETGSPIAEAWGAQETAALPVLDQIGRIEERRAQLAAQLRR
jgi:hypothetical protein